MCAKNTKAAWQARRIGVRKRFGSAGMHVMTQKFEFDLKATDGAARTGALGRV